jgi:hypothetical protein
MEILPIILTEPAIGVGKEQFRLIMAMVAKNLDICRYAQESITDKLILRPASDAAHSPDR